MTTLYDYLEERRQAIEENRNPDIPLAKKCSKSYCNNRGSDESHTCPFLSEIHYDDVTQCNCCPDCQHQCAMDI